MMRTFRGKNGNIVAMLMGTVAMVGIVGVSAMNMIGGPITTAAKVTHQNMAQNDLLMNAKVVVMNASTRPQMGDEDGDGYIEPVPFVPASDPSCGLSLPAGGQGGCLPADIGAILTDPWGTSYAYCVWDHGDPASSTNRIDGEDSTSGAVLAIISAGPNKRFETPCRPYDGDPDTNDEAIDPNGIGDDLVQIFTYAGAVAGSGGLWELKLNEPETAVIDKKLEIGDVSAGTGFAFDTLTGTGEFPYVKTDFIASKTGGNRPVTMMNNIALDGQWLSGSGNNRGIFIDAQGRIKLGGHFGGNNNPPFAVLDVNAYPTRTHGVDPLTSVASDFAILLGCKTGGAGPTATCGTGRAVGFTLARQNSPTPNAMLEYRAGAHSFHNFAVDTPILRMDSGYLYQDNTVVIRSSSAAADKGILGLERSNGANALTVLNSGKVGIGTTSPDHHLSVVDDSDDPTVISLENINATGSKARSVLFLRGNGDASSNSGGLMYANTSFTLGANYESLRPQGLSLYTNPSASGGISIASASPTGVFTINTGGLGQSTERLRITADGNIGVGIITPRSSLDVSGGVRAAQGLPTSATGDNSNVGYSFGADGDTGMFTPGVDQNGREIVFMGNAHERMRINAQGRVGIGTSAPTELLQVNGRIDVMENRILRVATPTATTDAANKSYVDSLGGKSCTNGQVLKWNGTTWACAGDNIGAGGDNLGNHTATNNLMPSATNTHDIGSTFNRWKSGYFEHLVSRTMDLYRTEPAASEYADAYTLNVTNTAAVGRGTAIRAYTTSPSGYGITATGANNGQGTAAYFDSISPSATVVNVQARSSTGNTYGMTVHASQSPNGTGIRTSGGQYGLDGWTTNGRAVRGWASGSTGTNYGIFGQTNSPEGYGVYSHGRMHSTGALTVGNSVTATAFSGNGSSLTNLNASSLASGTVPIARIGTGTKNTTTFYRGDGTFAVPPTGADNLGNHTATANLNMSNRSITADVGTIRDASGGWVRTYGATGWYNQTYGGGWHMQDTTWIRAYSNKSVVTGGNMQAAAFLYGSDERLKADIRPLNLSLDDLDGIGTYRYHYRTDEDETPHIGVIAQEVQAVFPEAVQTGEDGMLSVDYPALVPVLLEAVKQLKAENDAMRRLMKEENDNLREEIRALTKGAR